MAYNEHDEAIVLRLQPLAGKAIKGVLDLREVGRRCNLDRDPTAIAAEINRGGVWLDDVDVLQVVVEGKIEKVTEEIFCMDVYILQV